MKPEVWQNDDQKNNLTENEKIIFDALSKEKKMDTKLIRIIKQTMG